MTTLTEPPAQVTPARRATSGQRVRDVPCRPRTVNWVEVAIGCGCALSAFAVTWLLFTHLTPLHGALGFLLVWFALFASIFWLTQRELHDAKTAANRLAAVLIGAAAVVTVLPLVLILGFVFVRGVEALRLTFFSETLQFVGPLDEATAGGALHSIVGTLEQVGIATLICVPLGLMTAVYLNEVGGRLTRPVRFVVDAMSGVPSIVAGLFIYAVVVKAYGFSGFAGALALSVLMLPTVTRTSEVMLRLVPSGLREGALALGSSEVRSVSRVVIPTARLGLMTAVILGIARAVGETAPLIVTTLGATSMNANPLSGQQDSLPLFVWSLLGSPKDAQVARAWTGALVLILLVLFLFTLSRVLGNPRRLRATR